MIALWLMLTLGHAREFSAWARSLHPPQTDGSETTAVDNPTPIDVAEHYQQTHDFFPALADRIGSGTGSVEIEEIGQSVRGQPIWAFHIEDPAEPPERSVLIFAGIHALEWISTEVSLELLDRLIERPVPGVRVTVIPLLNPDGRDKVERDLATRRNAYRRGNWNNIDLNRDFSVNTDATAVWKTIIPGYYSHSETPMSQPETRALDALLARERYGRAASLHAFGGFFYAPWSGSFKRIPEPDRRAHWELGRSMEQAQGSHAYRTRQLGRWGFFFRAHGSELDHIYGRYETKTFLIELTRSGIRLSQPKDFRTYFRWYNPTQPQRHLRKGVAALEELIWVQMDSSASDDHQ